MSLHGGDIVGFYEKYGREPLDFSASLNPQGTPPQVLAAAAQALEQCAAYPDPHCRRLTRALGRFLQAREEQILLGSGAADVLFRWVWALRPRRALLAIPCFSEYQKALLSVRCAVQYFTLRPKQQFQLDESILDAIRPGLDVIILCQPGNPTGQLTDPELLRRIVEKCRETGTHILLDECFLSLVPQGQKWSLQPLLAENPHLFILGSFTKLYAMAGLRLGYGLCSDPRLLAQVQAAGQAWPVSNIAQAAGLAALEQKEYVARSLRALAAEKRRVVPKLQALGLNPLGEANYLFFHSPCGDLHLQLAKQGILIRDCSNFPGLGKGYYRIALRLPQENQMLLDAMQPILTGREE